MPYTSTFTDEQARLHVHDYSRKTSCDLGHSHLYPGVTGPPIPSGKDHYHQILGQTTYDFGHYHVYNACTGLSIMLPDGQHTHFLSFKTSFNFGHSHEATGYVRAAFGEDRSPKHP